MAGRKPKPTALKIVAGVRKSRINRAEPKFAGGCPPFPEHLPDGAREPWEYYGNLLSEQGVMTLADRGALANLARWTAIQRVCDEAIRDGRMFITNEDGYESQSGYVVLLRQASDQVRKWSIELGLTPAARTKIKAEPAKRDALDAFLKDASG